MDHFHYVEGCYHSEQVSLSQIADQFGTPSFVYSRATIERHWHAFNDAFGDQPHLICYAVKASSNIAILNLLARLGSGFDIVSQGELERVLAAGGNPENVVFSGVGKTKTEIERALEVGIKCFNVESESELKRIESVAAVMGKTAPISIRVNPDVDAKTHPYIATGLKENKFGVDMDCAKRLYHYAADSAQLNIVGIDCHIGSQLTSISPYLDAVDRILALVDDLKQSGIALQHIDMGGGLGITYQEESPPSPKKYIAALIQKIDPSVEVIIEPGRAIVGNAGILLCRVEYLKETSDRNYAIIDAAMNDLIRPALYQSWHTVVPVMQSTNTDSVPVRDYDIVGPVCETGDFIAKQRPLQVIEGDLLAIRSAGAYGFTMSSNYNTRNRAAEVMVDGEQSYLIRPRERYEAQFAQEFLLP